MKKLLITCLLTAAICSGTGCTPDDSIHRAADESAQRFEEAGVQNMKNDALFLAEITSANMLQVQLAKLAETKAVSPEVKKLAQNMQQEHSQVLEEINTIAEQDKFILPDALGDAHQEDYEEISTRSGLSFDLAYIKQAVESHQNMLDRYEDMADNGVSMNIKQFSSKQVPLARQHLEVAKDMERRVSDI